MPTLNEQLLDRQIAHGVAVNRFAGGLARDIIALIDETDGELRRRLLLRVERMQRLGFDTGPATTERLRRMLKDLRAIRARAYRAAELSTRGQLKDFAAAESAFQAELIRSTAPAAIKLSTVTLERLASIVTADPFTAGNGAAALGDWFADLPAAELKAIERTVRAGMVAGDGVGQIVRNVMGAPGVTSVLQAQRRHVETVVRSAVLHVGNTVREDLAAANADILKGLQWVGTLDIRICPTCLARDGYLYSIDTHEPLDGGPPYGAGPGRLHPRDRCVANPVVKSAEELGLEGGSDAETMRIRASMDGEVPAKLNARQWIDRAAKDPDLFERAKTVLGARRADMLRQGVLKPEDLFNFKTGELWTLKQLVERIPRLAA